MASATSPIKEEKVCRGEETCSEDDELHLYFIGNSYSPGLAQSTQKALIAGGSDPKGIRVGAHTPGGETFGGHFKHASGEGPKGTNHPLHQALAVKPDRKWNWIVLQNQSQLPGFIHDDPNGYERTVQNAKKLQAYVKEHNPTAQLLFFMTWGRRTFDNRNPTIYPDFLTSQAKLTAGYLQYVAETSTPENLTFVAPCGLVFQTIYQDLKEQGKNPTEAGSLFHGLYRPDGHHPSAAGSYVNAVTIYATLTGKDANQLEWVAPGLDAEIARQLRDAVSRTITETAASGLIRYPWQLL